MGLPWPVLCGNLAPRSGGGTRALSNSSRSITAMLVTKSLAAYGSTSPFTFTVPNAITVANHVRFFGLQVQ
jgi:hypothetical protein